MSRTVEDRPNGLTVLGQVHRKLATVTAVPEAKELRDKAAAIQRYVKATRQGLEVQNRAAYIRLLCERRAGELLAGVPRAKGDTSLGKKAGSKTRSKLGAVLKEAGIAPSTAQRWQYLARAPESELERLLTWCNDGGDELTLAYAVAAVRSYLESQEDDEERQRKDDIRRRARELAERRGKTRKKSPPDIHHVAKRLMLYVSKFLSEYSDARRAQLDQVIANREWMLDIQRKRMAEELLRVSERCADLASQLGVDEAGTVKDVQRKRIAQ